MDGLNRVYDRIDQSIGNLRVGLDQYTQGINRISDLHDIIIANAVASEDTLLFLVRLNDALFAELSRVEGAASGVRSGLGNLEEELTRRNATIAQLNAEIANHRVAVTEAQRRAELQAANIATLNTDMTAANSVLARTSQHLNQFNERTAQLKRKRDDEVQSVRANLQRREALAGQLQNLEQERAELRQLLTAVDTVPLQPQVQVQAPQAQQPQLPATGPGSRVTSGLATSNILPNTRRGQR